MFNTATVAAAVALLASSVASMPNLQPRVTDSPQPWVSVGDDGKPTTVTPVVTTISGVATVISGAPNDLTATVFTQTNYGQVTTSTGTAPAPTATATDGAGSFAVCNNKDGANAPWCTPTDGANLYPGTTYYCMFATPCLWAIIPSFYSPSPKQSFGMPRISPPETRL